MFLWTMPFRLVYQTADISSLSPSFDSADIFISCSVVGSVGYQKNYLNVIIFLFKGIHFLLQRGNFGHVLERFCAWNCGKAYILWWTNHFHIEFCNSKNCFGIVKSMTFRTCNTIFFFFFCLSVHAKFVQT